MCQIFLSSGLVGKQSRAWHSICPELVNEQYDYVHLQVNLIYTGKCIPNAEGMFKT